MLSSEKTWYDQAFGPLRNIMNVNIEYMPSDDNIMKIKELRVIGTVTYKMFPELYDEFDVNDYESEFKIEMSKMDQGEDEDGQEKALVNFFEY